MGVFRIYQAPSPFNAVELPDMDFEQTADVLYLAHENHKPNKLIRLAHDSWTFNDVAFGPTIAAPTGVNGTATQPNTDAANSGNADFPQPRTYVVTAFDEDTGQESRASSTVTLTNSLNLLRNYNTVNWTAVTGATNYRVYCAENSQLFGYIGTTDQLTFRDDNIGPDYSQGPPIGDNPFASDGDYPGSITFHEQRACWGRTINRPNGIWFSRSADYENMDFTRPSRADDSFPIGLVANKVNSVNQLVSHKQGLLALTSHNIFTIQGSNEDYISASPPPRVRPEISRGASKLNPITVDNVVFYEPAKLGGVRTIGYQFEIDGLKTDDVTIFSRHLFDNQEIVDWAYAEKPASAVWLVRGDGKLLCLTWDEAQQVWGWTVCDTDGLFKRVCCITEENEDRVYFLVERTIQGQTKLYVERMASELWTDQKDACFLDCARTFTNDVPVSTVDHLEHLEGQTVKAWVDGAAISANGSDPLVVTNGAVTLPVAGLKITIGLPYTAKIETLPLAFQAGSGWTVARPQQATRVILKVVDSRNISAGPTDDLCFPIPQRNTENYGDPIALLTGDFDVQMAGTSQKETVVVVKSDDPTPMFIAGVLIEPNVAS
jgi:hypothetical protein